MRMRGLAAALLYTTGGLTRLMDRRVRDGSVAREVSATDRRVIYAVLTDRGVATIRKASKSHLRGVQRHFGALFEDAELGAAAPFMSCIAHAQDADLS